MTLHREGKETIIITIITLLAINIAARVLAPQETVVNNIILAVSVVLLLIVLQFFRKPDRVTLIQDGKVIAPADGKVVVIEEVVENEYFNEPRRQISIFMSPFNVHINYNPISGIVRYAKYHPGKYLVAWNPKSSTENERTTFVVQHPSGVEILFRQIAGAMARRIVWYIDEGKTVIQGQEFGFIKFGSRVDVFLPLDAKVTVTLEQKTVGGQTIIAEL